jgi:glycosyltransferase involved in cell wall biosynthesis
VARIAIVNDIAGVAQLEVAGLRHAGWDVDFYELPKPGASWPVWAKALTLPVRLAMYLPVVLSLRRGRYDLVHVHFVSQGVVGAASGRPFFLHAHGSDLHLNMRNALMRWWSRAWMKRARGVFYVTPNLAGFVASLGPKAKLVPNPVETALFAAVPTPHRVENVLVFMRLEPIKGAEIAFEAADQIAGVVSLAALDWGPQAAGYRGRHAKHVHFIPPVPHGDVPELLAHYDAVIGQLAQGVPGLSELEAMAAGRVVLMRLDADLFPGDAPPVVNVRSGKEIVAALDRLRGDAAEVRRLSEAGRAWVERNHGIDAHVQTLIESYRSVIGGG